MEDKEKFDVRNQVNDEVVTVAAEAAEATEARDKDREVNDRADVQADEATVTSVEQIGTSVVQTETCVEQAIASVDNVDTSVVQTVGSEEGMKCEGAAEVTEPLSDGYEDSSEEEPGGDECGETSVAELVERARQEGYESGYSRGYDEARGKSIEEWMQESAGNEVWDYGEESEVMILNNIRPSIWE